MIQLQRGDKIYLDLNNTDESLVNTYLDCRDGIVECYEYRDCSGYGTKTRLFLCRNTKHESVSIIRQSWSVCGKRGFKGSAYVDWNGTKRWHAECNNNPPLNEKPC